MPEQFDPYHVWLGIPPEEQPPNHYRLLGLRPFEANADVISNAMDQRRVFLRSVQAGKRGAQSQQLLNEVSAAGVLLLDPAKKAQYDTELRKRLSLRPAGVVHPAAAGLPDPMAPLALPSILPQQPMAAGPMVRNASPAATSAPPSRAPVILSSRAARRSGKGSSSSATMITAVVLSGAALLLILILGGVWWSMSRTKAPESVVEITTAPTSPPGLPPSLPPLGASGGEPTSTASKNSSVVNPSASSNRSALPLPSGAAVAPSASQQRLALVFNGNESVQIPLPEEITKSGGEFTWEMWAKWDSYEPAGVLLDCGHMRIDSRAWENQSEPAFNAVHVSTSGGGNGSPGVKRGEGVHIAGAGRQHGRARGMDGLDQGGVSREPG